MGTYQRLEDKYGKRVGSLYNISIIHSSQVKEYISIPMQQKGKMFYPSLYQ